MVSALHFVLQVAVLVCSCCCCCRTAYNIPLERCGIGTPRSSFCSNCLMHNGSSCIASQCFTTLLTDYYRPLQLPSLDLLCPYPC